MFWTDERVAELRKSFADGVTCGQLAKSWKVSRSTIIGKAYRLGMKTVKQERQPVKQAKFYKPKPPSDHPKAGPILTTLPMPKSRDTDVARVSLIDIQAHQCKFPVGDNPGSDKPYFCGLASVGSYCPDHTERCCGPQPRVLFKPSASVRILQYA